MLILITTSTKRNSRTIFVVIIKKTILRVEAQRANDVNKIM